ncbi:unnamed protein product [Paramecium sonneborni]|uniref:Diphosphomevalonate decarboxylase-like N-terminal domain-containing protein n=1 Tax=Paramecium sonneborni TaxID=65129 RepID=A0A8S1KB01_9CILI|nr:unnamed protein product [Paramecium sonneborni]
MFTQLNNKITLISSFKTAPNIGLIKYWGKWNEKEINPLNTQIKVTLNRRDIFTSTTSTLNPQSDKNQLNFNNSLSDKLLGQLIPDIVRVESNNSFSTGSGLASLSSGLSALTLFLQDILKTNIEVRYLSRIGSGMLIDICMEISYYSQVSIKKNLDKYDQVRIDLESERCLSYQIQNS